MTKIKKLIRELVNGHAAQTGMPTVHGEDIRQLVFDILEDDDLKPEDVALIEHLTQGELRAGPVDTDE